MTLLSSHSSTAPLGCGVTGSWIIDAKPADLQQLCDAIVSIWTKISEACFLNLCQEELKQCWSQQGQPSLSEVCLIMWLVDVMFGKAAELDKTFLH